MMPARGDPPVVDGLPNGRCTGKIPPFEMLARKLPFEMALYFDRIQIITVIKLNDSAFPIATNGMLLNPLDSNCQFMLGASPFVILHFLEC